MCVERQSRDPANQNCDAVDIKEGLNFVEPLPGRLLRRAQRYRQIVQEYQREAEPLGPLQEKSGQARRFINLQLMLY